MLLKYLCQKLSSRITTKLLNCFSGLNQMHPCSWIVITENLFTVWPCSSYMSSLIEINKSGLWVEVFLSSASTALNIGVVYLHVQLIRAWHWPAGKHWANFSILLHSSMEVGWSCVFHWGKKFPEKIIFPAGQSHVLVNFMHKYEARCNSMSTWVREPIVQGANPEIVWLIHLEWILGPHSYITKLTA